MSIVTPYDEFQEMHIVLKEVAEVTMGHNNGWNEANTMETMCLMYFIPFHLFRSGNYHKSILPNEGATIPLCFSY
jgi:hypothetical protein